ncbi:MAG: hypothetical protein EXR98_02485 [Gemmataceae bacterium]|nr:hypothetical protein [Gemmataceae bacterium]
MITFLCFTLTLCGQPAEPLRFQETPQKTRQVIAKLPAAQAAKLPAGRLTQEVGETILGLALVPDDTKKPGPAILGKYERNGNDLAFTPRFPLEAGQSYRATLKLDGREVTLDYRMPKAVAKSPPGVVKIYPTADVLPANHLKFYIYFDRPMRGGEDIFNKIVLVDDKGKEISDPWLIDEIWDEENNCLIIYIHPGRIKWGVELRELLGPVLFEKRNYSLVIRGELTDLDGNKIGKDVVKKFRTTPEDRVRIDFSQWKLTAPNVESREALVLTLSKSIDHRSLQRFLTVTDDKKRPIEGKVSIGKEEKAWQFTPMQPWQARGYRLEIDGQLEDVAGNTPVRAFDFDLKAPKLAPQNLRFEFQPR